VAYAPIPSRNKRADGQKGNEVSSGDQEFARKRVYTPDDVAYAEVRYKYNVSDDHQVYA